MKEKVEWQQEDSHVDLCHPHVHAPVHPRPLVTHFSRSRIILAQFDTHPSAFQTKAQRTSIVNAI